MATQVFPADLSYELTTVQGHIDPNPEFRSRVDVLIEAIVVILPMGVDGCHTYSVGGYGVPCRARGVAVEETHAKRGWRALRAAMRHEVKYVVWMIQRCPTDRVISRSHRL